MLYQQRPELFPSGLNKLRSNVCENVPFFFKQWGGWGADGRKRNKKANGRLLLGKVWDNKPRAIPVVNYV